MPAAIRDAAVAAQGGTQVYVIDPVTGLPAIDPVTGLQIPVVNMFVDANGNELQVPFIRRLEFGTRIIQYKRNI